MKLINPTLVAALTTAATLCSWSFSAAASNLKIGQNFTGVTLNEVQELNGFGIAPPDTMGAVGLDHFVEFVNGAFAIYDKSNGTSLQLMTDYDFWTNVAGVSLPPTNNDFFLTRFPGYCYK